MAKFDPDRMYLAIETVSITVNEPYDFVTFRLGERRSGRDPLVQSYPEWFVDELDSSPGQLERESKERQLAATEAEREQRRAERQEAERLSAEQREQERIAAKGRTVQVYPPYLPEQANPLSERGLHPMAYLAAGVAAAMDPYHPDAA
jgi:hypothetical protein